MKAKKQICNDFFTIEADENLFDVKINDVNIWNNVRTYVYTVVMARIGLLTDETMSETMIQHKRCSRLKVLKQLLEVGDFVKYIPFFRQKRDLLCVLFPVRRKNGRFDEEIYVDKYYSQIRGYTYYALEWAPGISERFANPQTHNLRYTCDDVILAWFGKKENIPFKNICREFNHFILKKLEIGLEISFTKTEKRKIYRELYLNYYKRNAYIRFYRFILKQICPKAILYYNGAEYYTQLLVEVGRMCNIKTIEIQHGLFGWDVPCFNLQKKGVPTVPEYFLTYGELFNDLIQSEHIKTISIGRPDIFQKVHQYRYTHSEKSEKKTLLFVSSCDGTIEYLGKIWNDVDYTRYKVILKLHPSEFMTWRKNYPFLINAKKIEIVNKTDRDMYYWINKADYMIGYWSTAFYEALPFPVVKILISDEVPYTNYMIKEGYALYGADSGALMDIIEQVENGQIQLKKFEKDDYFMYSYPINRMDNVLKEVISGN